MLHLCEWGRCDFLYLLSDILSIVICEFLQMVSITYLPCTIYPAAPAILSLILERKFGAWIKENEEDFVFASTSPDPHFDLQQRSVARSRTTSTKVTVDLKDARWSASDGKSSTRLK